MEDLTVKDFLGFDTKMRRKIIRSSANTSSAPSRRA
jgi:hypothetical protein